VAAVPTILLQLFLLLSLITQAARVQSHLYVCLSVCPRSNRKMAWVLNNKLGTCILHSSRSTCRHALTQRSKGQGHTVTKIVNVARLLVTMSRISHTTAGVGLHIDTTAYVF